MQGALDHLAELYKNITAGHKPDAGLLKHLKIPIDAEYYSLEEMCLISEMDTFLRVQPFDRSWVPIVYQTINDAKLGVTPEKTKDVILVKFPSMTGDRRQELIKLSKDLAEKQRIALRNIRRDARKILPDSHKQIESMTEKALQTIDQLFEGQTKKLQGSFR